ncbi:SDR family oxidoreductase [Larkinella rosea]|uniref:SDR family NAD(P)-dependent oxidoreductase n=1 Tax=Larkinella rosea TaxID=2025312 RepID=A0A3P1B8Z7_9BACT|nr:SDR family NAD(P)-dependent oxidoreductase [Larkinella rosea]RRA97556.1 SDR family NAD(P)-dependent oxidoreductase [Larkinella rosea]
MKVTNHTILLTGGTSGIGYELVKRFYNFGNRLLVVASDPARLHQLQIQFPEIITLPCNLADPAQVDALIQRCRAEHQDITILINNAGVQYNYDWTTEPDGSRKITNEITVNLTSPLHLIYGLLPLLLKQPEAAIVNVSSGLAYAPKKSAPVYGGTKAAIHSVTKALRYQLEPTSVKVFEIIPALVETPMTAGRGTGKMSPEQLVDEFMPHFRNDRLEIPIGKTKLLRLLQRFSPALADRIMKNN